MPARLEVKQAVPGAAKVNNHNKEEQQQKNVI